MKYTTNLFPKKEQSIIDKITYFALHYLRYILVITQFVTICVFFYRFKADQEIVDLKDTLSQKRAIVETTQTLLDRVKELDFKIANIKKLYSQQDTLTTLYSYIFENLPEDISIHNMTIEQNGIQFQGKSQNIETVRILYEKLKDEKKFATVTLDGITKSEEGFSFRLELLDFKQSNGN